MNVTTMRSMLVSPSLAAFLAMAAAAGLAGLLAPKKTDASGPVFSLEELIPAQIGEWREIRTGLIQMDLTPRRAEDDRQPDMNQPYDQTVMRTYAKPDGTVVMLAVAYGSTQRQEVKIHRPELCYTAQGFRVSDRRLLQLALPNGATVTTTRLIANAQQRVEPVTYWIRIGEQVTTSAWQSRLAILREGLQGRIPDGVLVRVSQAMPAGRADIAASFAVQEEFLLALIGSLDARGQEVLARSGKAVRPG